MLLMEARVDHTTPGSEISSLSTMLTTTMKAFKKKDIKVIVARKRLEAILFQYLRTMKDSTWDKLRDEFTQSDYKDTPFAKYLETAWQTVPNVKKEKEIMTLARQWVLSIDKGGFEFAKHMAMKPGMKRLKPKPETIALYDAAVNGGELGVDPAKATSEPSEDELKEIYARNAALIANKLAELVASDSSIMDVIVKSMSPSEKEKYTSMGSRLNTLAGASHVRLVGQLQKVIKKDVEEVILSKKW